MSPGDVSSACGAIAAMLHTTGARIVETSVHDGLPLLSVPGAKGLLRLEDAVRMLLLGGVAAGLKTLEEAEKARATEGASAAPESPAPTIGSASAIGASGAVIGGGLVIG